MGVEHSPKCRGVEHHASCANRQVRHANPIAGELVPQHCQSIIAKASVTVSHTSEYCGNRHRKCLPNDDGRKSGRQIVREGLCARDFAVIVHLCECRTLWASARRHRMAALDRCRYTQVETELCITNQPGDNNAVGI